MKLLCRKATNLFVIPAEAGIQKQKNQAWIPAGVHPALDAGRE
jgi:hypothetical protein